MKSTRGAIFIFLVATLANGFSFSEIENESAPAARFDRVYTGNTLPVDEESRVYGGSNTKVNKYPFTAGLRANGSDSENYCGGTLVAPQFVATAAHCIDAWLLIDMYVSLGSKKLSGRGSKTSEQIKVVEAFIHPLYNRTEMIYDVALLKLEFPASHEPALLGALDGSDNKAGTIATVVGWMVNNGTYTMSQTLQSLDLELLSDEECATFYPGYQARKSIMCAGNVDTKGLCDDADGGPLVVNGILVGIAIGVSLDCEKTPGLFTHVARILDYINDIISGGSSGNVSEILSPSYDGFMAENYM
ncbi:hypothetical protein PHMEG_0008619 [Phytophthora megakarya]|uniref:Peptidase S1 domain-containing protein n=1 Tax=Phytophthora megakarya TaxID=4795 RepID=A0A225WJ33_9STRA|nr:hypothetical protein PHMEG_0008619 [Phytophthora megakarya]